MSPGLSRSGQPEFGISPREGTGAPGLAAAASAVPVTACDSSNDCCFGDVPAVPGALAPDRGHIRENPQPQAARRAHSEGCLPGTKRRLPAGRRAPGLDLLK